MANGTSSRAAVPNVIKVLVAVLALTGINVFILPRRNGFANYDWFLFEGIFCLVLTPLIKRKDAPFFLALELLFS